MSDVGLDAQLSLDIRQAIQQVARLERALDAATHVTVTADARGLIGAVEGAIDAADSSVTVTGEAAELTGDVTAAVDAADTAVSVTGDASQLTGEVTAGVDAGDSHVEVTGDAAELTGEVTAAVDAGDSNVVVTGDASELTGEVTAAVDAADTAVTITADSGPLREAAGASDALGLSLGTARLNATGLGTVLRGGLFVAAAKQIYDTVQAASDLEESVSKTNVVFAEGSGDIKQWGQTASQSVGLSEQAALEAAGTFGNLFTALGQSREEATALAPSVVQLSGDLASFNNLRVDETLEKMRSGLVGEIEPLRSLGISFNAAQVEAKAMELGLADANGEISEGAKVSARWALIQEQSSNAAGDFARTSDGLANQQRILTAEFQNTVTAIGVRLLPAMKQLVTTGLENLPVLEDLGVALGDTLVAGLGAVVPLLGTTTTLLTAGLPIIEAFATGVDAIPDPLLQVVAALFALNRVLKLSSFLGAATGMTKLGAAGGGLLGVLGRINPVVAVGAALLTAYSIQASHSADAAARTAAQHDLLVKSLEAQGGAIKGATTFLQDLVRGEEKLVDVHGRIESIDVKRTLTEAGISAGDFARSLNLTNHEFGAYATRLDEAAGANGELADDLTDLRAHFQTVTLETIAAGVESGRWTERQREAARGMDENGRAANSVAEQLAILTGIEAGAGTATGGATRQFQAQAAALLSLSEAAPGVGMTLGALTTHGGLATDEFVRMAAAIGQANLSQEQMQVVADQLGVPLDVLALHVDQVNASIEGFVSNVQSSLPNLATSLSALGEDVTFQGIRDEFQRTYEAMVSFEANLALLAAFPNVQAAAAAAGPEVAAALAQGVKDGKTQSLNEMELLATGTAQTEQSIVDTARNVYGPNFAAAQAAAGIGGTDAFTRGLNLGKPASAQGDAAINIIRGKQGQLESAASGAGGSASRGFRTGVAPIPGHASAAAAGARAAIGESAYSAGYGAGSSMGSGFIAGLDIYVGAAADKAAQLVLQAKAAADRAARSGSPSRLFMELGADIGAGLAIGIEDQRVQVQAASRSLVSVSSNAMLTAIDEIQAAATEGVKVFEDFSFQAQVAPTRLAAAAGAGVTINVEAGAVVIQIPSGADERTARRLGEAAGARFLGMLQDRQLAATARFQ